MSRVVKNDIPTAARIVEGTSILGRCKTTWLVLINHVFIFSSFEEWENFACQRRQGSCLNQQYGQYFVKFLSQYKLGAFVSATQSKSIY